jgi:peptidoglycan/xylan/chitin deacetylase (PgdA/CDA1 family)
VNPFDGSVLQLEPYEERYKSFLICSRLCAKLAASELQQRVSEIEEALDVKLEPDTPIMLDWEGVKELESRGHTVGSHTVWHPNVAQIPAEDARQELTASRAKLSEVLGKSVPHFSYPSPILEPHWTEQTVRLSADVGYQTAVTCTRGSVKVGDNPLSLKRMAVPEPFADFVWALENQFAGRYT